MTEEPREKSLLLLHFFFLSPLLDFLLRRARRCRYCSLSTTPSLSLSLAPLPLPRLKGNKSAGFPHQPFIAASFFSLLLAQSVFFLLLAFFLSPRSLRPREMIRFPTEACCFSYCGGEALVSVGRFNCPRALPVRDGDAYQNSRHTEPRPATFHA